MIASKFNDVQWGLIGPATVYYLQVGVTAFRLMELLHCRNFIALLAMQVKPRKWQ